MASTVMLYIIHGVRQFILDALNVLMVSVL